MGSFQPIVYLDNPISVSKVFPTSSLIRKSLYVAVLSLLISEAKEIVGPMLTVFHP